MFCGSLCMSYLGAILRNIYQGWPLDWYQRPRVDAVLLFGISMFSLTLFIGHFVRSSLQKTSPFLLLIFGLDITVIYALQSLIPMR